MPDYLTPEEAVIFRSVLKALPPGLARRSDLHCLARYSAWLKIWMDGRKRYATDHDRSGLMQMRSCELILTKLEDRLTLNIAARTAIVHKLLALPSSLPSGDVLTLADDVPVSDDTAPPPPPPPAAAGDEDDDASPLNWLNRAPRSN